MIGYRNDVVSPTDTAAYLLFRFNGSEWRKIDSIVTVLGFPPPRFGMALGCVANDLYSLSNRVYRFNAGNWDLLTTLPDPLVGVYGTGRHNLFVVGLAAGIFHHDGSDWYRVPQFPRSDIDFYGVWADDHTVFVVGNDGRKTYVARGK